MIRFPKEPSEEDVEKTKKALNAFHVCTNVCIDCLDLLNSNFYKNDLPVVLRYDDEVLDPLLRRFNEAIPAISPTWELDEDDIVRHIKRMKGFGKTNGVYKQEVKDVLATLLYHGLIYNAYILERITQTSDGILLKLKEGTVTV